MKLTDSHFDSFISVIESLFENIGVVVMHLSASSGRIYNVFYEIN